MNEEQKRMVTAIAVPGDDRPGLEENIIVTAEENEFSLKIRDALLSDPRMGGADLVVRFRGKCAVLSGTARTDEQREAALNIAGRFVGRDHVADNIETGEQISYDVCEA